ncbi:MAG: AAA family ATPase [Candidatus Thiodiazotropha lotti]|uniref:DNA 5'-3' helicase n=1 Tax=Candidatus Thiodiazotropha lotti TaxID=2792787 RepID=A0A9E4K5C0_9GAMM|nr:AAA family ATPase [Candidatus Thiodiazotropha lotti]MCW4203975.1 AAA family ATPase [Candidatus Thiodiazotropha lotti]
MTASAYYVEQRVLGGILVDSSRLIDCPLSPSDFQQENHEQIFRAILELETAQNAIDVVTLAQYLEKTTHRNFLPLLQACYQAADGRGNHEAVTAAVKQQSTDRKLIEIAERLAEDKYPDAAIAALMQLQNTGRQYDFTLNQALAAALEDIESDSKGIPSGLTALDNLTGGCRAGDLIIEAGRPAMGKTASLVNRILSCDVPCGFISSEQGASQIAMRLLALQAGVNSWGLRNNNLSDQSWGRITDGLSVLKDRQIFINDKSSPKTTDVARQARAWVHNFKVQILFVDYIQRLAPTDRKLPRHLQIEEIAQGLKSIARELSIPVVAAAQVKREVETRNDKRPTLSDLKDSGSIEQEADQVISLYRDQYYNPETNNPGIAEFAVLKNRHGPTGVVKVNWSAQHMAFTDLNEE